MEFSSKLLEKAVNEMAQLPGIGKRTALRLVLHLLKQPVEQTQFLSQALTTMREEVKFCASCHNISDVEICEICANTSRNSTIICVVEDIRDVMAIENTGQFKGIYHVLGGKISPSQGLIGVAPCRHSWQARRLVDSVRGVAMLSPSTPDPRMPHFAELPQSCGFSESLPHDLRRFRT